MRKRNKCGLFLSLCMAVAWTTQAQTSADGYVIAVEGDDVYIDLAEGKIAKGDILEVCSKPGYFVHPVTKKRIRKESKRISSLIVKDVFGDYSTAKSVPSQTLESIQVGMPSNRNKQHENLFPAKLYLLKGKLQRKLDAISRDGLRPPYGEQLL